MENSKAECPIVHISSYKYPTNYKLNFGIPNTKQNLANKYLPNNNS